MPNKHKCISADYSLYEIPRGLTARIAGFHPAGPGSTPGVGNTFFPLKVQFRFYRNLLLSGPKVQSQSNH